MFKYKKIGNWWELESMIPVEDYYFKLTEEDFVGIGHAIMAIEEGYV